MSFVQLILISKINEHYHDFIMNPKQLWVSLIG